MYPFKCRWYHPFFLTLSLSLSLSFFLYISLSLPFAGFPSWHFRGPRLRWKWPLKVWNGKLAGAKISGNGKENGIWPQAPFWRPRFGHFRAWATFHFLAHFPRIFAPGHFSFRKWLLPSQVQVAFPCQSVGPRKLQAAENSHRINPHHRF